MTEMVHRLDQWGQPAWIALMVLSLVVFWPIGLAVLFYLIWSGRMGFGCNGTRNRWQQRMAGKFEDKMTRWGMQAKAFERTGNAAFDEYREETLRRLEDEASQFDDFLRRLRMARDRKEFEDFMDERRRNPSGNQPGRPETSPDAGAQPA